jgi:hypothetical protein
MEVGPMKRASFLTVDGRILARRALALAHAAVERPTVAGIRDAKRMLTSALRMLDPRSMDGAVDLVNAARRLLDALVKVEERFGSEPV